jgi:hypothetical protein
MSKKLKTAEQVFERFAKNLKNLPFQQQVVFFNKFTLEVTNFFEAYSGELEKQGAQWEDLQ